MADKKWTRPSAPPSPLFTGEKERDFVKQVNDEIQERIIGQTILYFSVDFETTNFDPVYGEAPIKNFLPPVECQVAVEWKGQDTLYENTIGIEKMTEIEVKFSKRRISDEQNVFLREGDFILYGGTYFEIVSLSIPDELFGQQDQKFSYTAICKRARRGLFNAS